MQLEPGIFQIQLTVIFQTATPAYYTEFLTVPPRSSIFKVPFGRQTRLKMRVDVVWSYATLVTQKYVL